MDRVQTSLQNLRDVMKLRQTGLPTYEPTSEDASQQWRDFVRTLKISSYFQYPLTMIDTFRADAANGALRARLDHIFCKGRHTWVHVRCDIRTTTNSWRADYCRMSPAVGRQAYSSRDCATDGACTSWAPLILGRSARATSTKWPGFSQTKEMTAALKVPPRVAKPLESLCWLAFSPLRLLLRPSISRTRLRRITSSGFSFKVAASTTSTSAMSTRFSHSTFTSTRAWTSARKSTKL